MKVAALFVEQGGVYTGRPEIDPWTLARDARRYAGPLSVIAHPPCGAWGAYARMWFAHHIGQDGGTFAAALAAVCQWGGVLEHPCSSSAWAHFDLPIPGGWGWTGPFTDARWPGRVVWTCAVDQGLYGHRARKRTWLLLVSPVGVVECPQPLRWGKSTTVVEVADMNRAERAATPRPFADLLYRLALGQYTATCDPLDRAVTCDPDLGDRCALRGCNDVVVQAPFGPVRRFCSHRCRQRASRQARQVSRAHVTYASLAASRSAK